MLVRLTGVASAKRNRESTGHRHTLTILGREGLDAVTTNRIAAVAGVSIGSLYQYFPDKRAIFLALHDRHVDDVDRLIKRTLHRTDASLEDLICVVIREMVDLHSRNPALHEMLLAEVPPRGGGSGDFPTRMHSAFRLAISSRDVYGCDDLDRAAFVMSHMVEALSHGAALRRPPGVSLADATIEAQRAALAYLRH